MKIAHVIPGVDKETGGWAHSVLRLCDTLAQLDAEVHLHVLAPARVAAPTRYELHSYPVWPLSLGLGISPTMKQALHQQAHSADFLHSHSLWTMPNVYPLAATRGTKCRLVMSPFGALSAWSMRRSAWKKRLMWFLAQEQSLHAAHLLHATAESEYHDIRTAGLRGPVAIIPNGVDLGPPPEHNTVGPRRLLFLSRFHPRKGIDILLHAWQRIESRFAQWELHIVGMADPRASRYQAQMMSLAHNLGVRRVFIYGPVFGAAKMWQFQQANLFVLPTHSENFGNAVAEALAHGVPAVVTRNAPWPGLETHDCGWWIEQGVESLEACLQSALALSSEQLLAKGQRGRQWMEQEFTWDRVGRRMLQTYQWLIDGGSPPEWVRAT